MTQITMAMNKIKTNSSAETVPINYGYICNSIGANAGQAHNKCKVDSSA